MTTYAHLEPYRSAIDKATCPGCRLGIPKKMSEHSSVVGQAEVHSNGWVCMPQTEHLLPILMEIIAAAEQAAREQPVDFVRAFATQYFLAGIRPHKDSMNPAEDLMWDVGEFLGGEKFASTCALADYRERVKREALEEAEDRR